MRLNEAIDGFLRTVEFEYGYSQHTVKAYRGDLRSLTEFIEAEAPGDRPGDVDVSVLDLELLRGWLWERQQRGYSPGTISRGVATLKSFGSWLEQRRILPGSPASRLQTPKKAKPLPRVLSEQQLDRILERAERRAQGGDPVAIRDRAILELLYATALRVSELCTLPLDGLELPNRTVRVTGKGDKQRVVPVGAPAARALHDYLERGRPGLLARAEGEDPGTLFLGNQGGRVLSQLRLPAGLERARSGARRRPPRAPHAAPQRRHAPAQRRRRPSGGAGDARPREPQQHPGLHPRLDRAPRPDVPAGPPAGLSRYVPTRADCAPATRPARTRAGSRRRTSPRA